MIKIYKRVYSDRTNFYLVEGEMVLCLSTFLDQWVVRSIDGLHDLEANAEPSCFAEVIATLKGDDEASERLCDFKFEQIEEE